MSSSEDHLHTSVVGASTTQPASSTSAPSSSTKNKTAAMTPSTTAAVQIDTTTSNGNVVTDTSSRHAAEGSEERDPRKRQRAVVNNHNRAAVFRKWLIETFPPESLKLILDVAGGKGEVSVPLALAGYECVVVDPRECDWSKNRIVKNLQFHMAEKNTKTYNALAERIGRERLERDGLPMPGRLLEYFTAASPNTDSDDAPHILAMPPQADPISSVVDDGGKVVVERVVPTISSSSSAPVDCCDSEKERAVPPPYTMHYVKTHCTLLVGMHSDEATEPIIDFAIAHRRPFAVIPCCVFPKDNPHRKHPVTGKRVESYESFVAYLKAKPTLCGGPIVEEVLPFEGRNIVLYYIPGTSTTSTPL